VSYSETPGDDRHAPVDHFDDGRENLDLFLVFQRVVFANRAKGDHPRDAVTDEIVDHALGVREVDRQVRAKLRGDCREYTLPTDCHVYSSCCALT